jgi:hypothetical protein
MNAPARVHPPRFLPPPYISVRQRPSPLHEKPSYHLRWAYEERDGRISGGVGSVCAATEHEEARSGSTNIVGYRTRLLPLVSGLGQLLPIG